MKLKRRAAAVRALSAGAAVLASSTAMGACWEDRTVIGLARGVVQQSFPELAGQMPQVLVCHAGDFPPGIGGDYNSGAHRIRLPEWLMSGQGNATGTLQHELCHASVAVRGEDDGLAQGHGAGFMRCLLQHGWAYEAERVAGIVPGAAQALQIARQNGFGDGGEYHPPRVAGGFSAPPTGPTQYVPPAYVPPTYAPPVYVPPIYVPPQRTCQIRVQMVQVLTPQGYVHVVPMQVRICR